MNRPLIAFYLILISCVFGLSVLVSRFVGNLTVLAAYTVFVVVVLTTITTPSDIRHAVRDRQLPNVPVRCDPAILYPTLVLWVVFLVGLALNPSPAAVLRAGAFVGLSAVTLFVIPAVISRTQAFTAIAVVGAACMIVALPAVWLGDVVIAGIPIDWAGVQYTRYDIVLHVPSVIFDTRNYFRVLVALGAVASAGLYAQTRKRWLVGVCFLNLIGVYVLLGRAARLAVLIAAALAIVYRLAGRRGLAGMTVIGVFATIVGFAVGLGLLPGPTAAVQAALGDRLAYWEAAYETVLARPVVGWGLVDTDVAIANRFSGDYTGVHNSYLRLFLIGGVLGGIAYLGLCASAVVTAFGRVREHAPLGLTAFCLVVMALLFQLFAGGTIFGTSLSSVLWALTIGYSQPDTGSGDRTT